MTALVGLALLLLPTATVVGYVLLGRVLSQGRQARVTQCKTFPISAKLYRAARRYKLITGADLQTFLASAPRDCP